MKAARAVKIPYDEYRKALNIQAMLLKNDGRRVPLWQCLKNDRQENTDFLRRVRL